MRKLWQVEATPIGVAFSFLHANLSIYTPICQLIIFYWENLACFG